MNADESKPKSVISKDAHLRLARSAFPLAFARHREMFEESKARLNHG
jgi:hypothetical protein